MPNESFRFSSFPLPTLLRRGMAGAVLIACASSGAAWAVPETTATARAKIAIETKAADALLIANPLRRPPVKEVHITYHRKKFYLCDASTDTARLHADAC